MRSFVPLMIVSLTACHATRDRVPPVASAPTQARTAGPVVETLPPPSAPTPTPPSTTLPSFGERFARRCQGYLRPLAISPTAARLAFCDRVVDDFGRYVATPEAPLAAVLDDGTSLQLHASGLRAVSPDGRVLGAIAARDVDEQSDRVELAPDGRSAAWLRNNGAVVIFALPSMQVAERIDAPSGCDTLSFAHDGTLIARSGSAPNLALARLVGGHWRAIALPAATRSVALTDNGRVALALHDEGRVTMLVLPTGEVVGERAIPVTVPEIPSPSESTLSPSPDGTLAVTCDASGIVLHALTGEVRSVTLRARCPGPPRFSADGRSIVTSDFGMTVLRAGEAPRAPVGDRPLVYEVPSVPAGFAPLVRVDTRGDEGLAIEGTSGEERSWATPEGFVRAWAHRTSGAAFWVTRRDGAELALQQPHASWARAAIEIYGGRGVDGTQSFAAHMWTLPDGARAVEATWRTDGCDPSTQTLRVQERDGAIALVRLEDWSSPRARTQWWRALVHPVLGPVPPDAVPIPRAEAQP